VFTSRVEVIVARLVIPRSRFRSSVAERAIDRDELVVLELAHRALTP
jgi:hypothetical protein